MLRNALRSFVSRGLTGTVRLVVEEIQWRMRVRRDAAFDRRWATDTGGTILASDLGAPPAAREHSARYQATDVATFERVLRALRIRHEQYAFVDLGSGKGRVLMMAARCRWRRIVGVEVSPVLHAIARRNLERFERRTRGCSRFELVCADVGAFDLPEGPLVLYLYNPFGPPVLERVLARLRASLERSPRHVLLVYRNPKHADVIERAGFLTPAGEMEGVRIWACGPERQ